MTKEIEEKWYNVGIIPSSSGITGSPQPILLEKVSHEVKEKIVHGYKEMEVFEFEIGNGVTIMTNGTQVSSLHISEWKEPDRIVTAPKALKFSN